MIEPVRMPTTIIHEEVVEDQEPRNGQEFIHRTLMDWTFGRLPWLDEALDSINEQRREEEENRQQSDDEEEEEPFRPALRETTWAAAGSRLQTECAVCLKDFEAEDKVSTMPCDHCFHHGCIFQWLQVSCVCPLCRHAL